MPVFHQAATEKTPEVTFDTDQQQLRLAGCSIHENAEVFFTPLMTKAAQYAKQCAGHTVIEVELEYFNSSSSKYLLDLFRVFDEIQLQGHGTVELRWMHAPDDLDMEEAGRDYAILLDMPVHLVSAPPR